MRRSKTFHPGSFQRVCSSKFSDSCCNWKHKHRAQSRSWNFSSSIYTWRIYPCEQPDGFNPSELWYRFHPVCSLDNSWSRHHSDVSSSEPSILLFSWRGISRIRTTLTTCPVTETIRSGTSESIRVTQTVSTVLSTLTSTVCTKCFAPSETQIISSVPTSQSSSAASGPPPAPAPAPPVLPKCLNTWITLTKCESNADSSCYCKDSEFTKNVQDCVSCWSADSSEVQAALSYLAGICAPDVQANPGIITNVPISITLGPGPIVTPAPSGSPATQAGTITAPAPVSLPVTIISLVETVTLPITYISGSSTGQPISSSFIISVISTQVTVPQVKFTTDTLPAGATGRPDVGLAAGSPVPVTAIPTSVSLSTFATGRTATGGSVVAQTSITPFIGGAGRASSGILRAVVVAALGLLVGIWTVDMCGGMKDKGGTTLINCA